MNNSYVLVNRKPNTDSKFVRSFKKSILGSEIGLRNRNFPLVITLSTILAIGSLFTMYYLFRI